MARAPYATSSKVTTVSDQFSVRIDHQLSDKSQLFGRFTMANVTGPNTNPSQTAIDPEFAVGFLDRQRNAAITYTRTPSPTFTMESGDQLHAHHAVVPHPRPHGSRR